MGREWQYKNIKARIVVEKLLLDENNEIPKDYKFHCFNGSVKIIQVDIDRYKVHRRNLYDRNWHLLECEWGFKKSDMVEKPSTLDKMISLAEKLAKVFIYVRVDFYSVKGQIYFGELTFHPGCGWERFSSLECDKKFGDLLKLKGFD